MSISGASKVYILITSFFGESLKLKSVLDHTVNVFYSTFTNVFFILVTFFTFLTFFYFNLNVFYIYG